MTHNAAGHVTHNTFVSSIQCNYRLIPGCMTSNFIGVSGKWHHNVTASYDMKIKLSYPSCQCHHIIIVPAPYNLSEKTKNHIIGFKQQHSKSMIVSIYVLPQKPHSNSRFDQKPHKHHKCSALPLVLAINRSIYYLLNNTFNQANDVSHLICRLLLMLQRYITRHNDFKHHWFTLLLSGLLRSQQVSLWFLIVLFLRIHVIAWKLFWIKKIIYTMNLIIDYVENLTMDKIAAMSSCLHFICF
jgi:hypothetical protein